MRVMEVKAENFASYEKLEFNFTNQGLALIQGPNGAGKSTLCDIIPWVLFGKTAKDGAVDEIIAWPGDKVCKATLFLENVTIHRSRGKNANDLMFWPTDGVVTRGKDLIDTQKLINNFLGFTYETYMAGAYYHEFSQTAQFFSTTAKNRRLITEQLVDLSLATNLHEKAQNVKKTASKELATIEAQLIQVTLKMSATENALQQAAARFSRWEAEQKTKAADQQAKYDKFERDREIDLNEARRNIQVQNSFIKQLPSTDLYLKCPTCGQGIENSEVFEARRQTEANNKAQQRIEILSEKIKEIKLRINPHKTGIVSTSENPYIEEIGILTAELSNAEYGVTTLETDLQQTINKIADLELLQEIIADYRSTVITNSIQSIQDGTNKLLTDHFDAEIRVIFSAETADKLEVEIMKDSNRCSYSQLSKGQRCLLKLCFGVAVMNAVATTNAVSFPQVFFDEALDGLSDTFKEKAFRLLQTFALNKEAIFVVEHSEAFKNLFDNAYTVSLANGVSEIAKTI